MNMLLLAVIGPILVGFSCFYFRRLAPLLALITLVGLLGIAIKLIMSSPYFSALLVLRSMPLNNSFFLMAVILTLLNALYSWKALETVAQQREYFAYLLITIGATAGVFFATDLITLMLFWGGLGIPLYLLIGINGPGAASAAKKTLMIVGGADALMIIGLALVWILRGSPQIALMPLTLNNPYTITAFLVLTIGAFAKAGVMPFHSWISDSAEQTPASVMALLPASLDKLLGIYLLIRICFEIFLLVPGSLLSTLLLALGSLTIMIAVFGALLQHDFRKLLAFHAVSQVGYMVVGLGTATSIGVAGALFHLFNNAIYKSCLFLCGGSIKKETGTADLDKLGGLAKLMPLTFASFLIAALAISGVPPLNGFVSKWLIYQAIFQLRAISPFWGLWLAAVMFGSAFTLASFIKVIHAIFLGQKGEASRLAKETTWSMWLPVVCLAALCVIFGLWAFALPLHYLVFPIIGAIQPIGIWLPLLSTGLICLGLLLGLLIYWLGGARTVSTKPVFIGGESLPTETVKVSGTEFYETIKDLKPLNRLCNLAARHWFDLYEVLSAAVQTAASWISRWQDGLIHTYLIWMFAGGILIFYWLLK